MTGDDDGTRDDTAVGGPEPTAVLPRHEDDRGDLTPHSAFVGFMSVPVSRRVPVRRSTVLMAVAFLGLGTVMYFNPPAGSGTTVATLPGTTPLPGIVPAETSTTTAPPSTVPPASTTSTSVPGSTTTTTTHVSGSTTTTSTTHASGSTTSTASPGGSTTTTSTTVGTGGSTSTSTATTTGP